MIKCHCFCKHGTTNLIVGVRLQSIKRCAELTVLNWPSLVLLKQHLFSHENIYEITWLKLITSINLCPIISDQKEKSYNSQSNSGCIVFFTMEHVESMDKSLQSASFWQWDKPSLQKQLGPASRASLSVTSLVSLSQECCHSNIKINSKLSWFIRMKCIPSYCTKRNNSMIYRITLNVFFVHWVACGKYRLLSVICIT